MKVRISNTLGDKAIIEPKEVLKDFFEWYSPEDAKEELWQWLVNIMSCAETEIYNKPIRRSDLFFFYEKLKSLISAANAITLDGQPCGPYYA